MSDVILSEKPLSFPWDGIDPFLFCAYHDDAYPAGNADLGPAASLAGRNIGQDFSGKDGWRMYHGDVVPGFPRHPHRGFETVTIMRRGFTDHADSLGATARFGPGDVQWITTGRGIVHSEMFPLLDRNGPNPVELFQIWLNLPSSDKLVDPYFAMFWSESVPRHVVRGANGKAAEITIVAGAVDGVRAPSPPPHSWAARPEADVAIWTIKLEPDAELVLPPASPGTNRTLYLFRGGPVAVDYRFVQPRSCIRLAPDLPAPLTNSNVESEFLLLQGRPIGETVAQYGPFVMNTQDELRQAFHDYQRTGFGGWPWPRDDHVHPPDAGRHARYIDGRIEKAG